MAADDRLTAIGTAAGVVRLPGDTATAYARRVDRAGPDGGRDLVAVASVIDRERYAAVAPTADARASAESSLKAAERPLSDNGVGQKDHFP